MKHYRTCRLRRVVPTGAVLIALGSFVTPSLAAGQKVLLDRVVSGATIETSFGHFAEGFALLPPGFLKDGEVLEMRQAAGGSLPVSALPLGRYPDGSARSVGLKALLPSAVVRGGRSVELLAMAQVPDRRVQSGQGSQRLKIERDPTGRVRCVATAGFEIHLGDVDGSVEISDAAADWSDRSRRSRIEGRIDSLGASCELAREGARLIHEDELSVRLVITGRCCGEGAEFGVGFELEIELRHGVPGFEGRWTIVPEADLTLSDWSLVIPLDRSRVRKVRALGATSGDSLEWAFDDETSRSIECLDGRDIRVATGQGDRFLDSAQRCGFMVRGTDGALGITVSRMRALSPKRIVLTSDGSIRLEALPGTHHLEAGIPIVTRFALGAVPRGGGAAKSDPIGLAWLAKESVRGLARWDEAALPFDVPLVIDPEAPFDTVSRCVMALDRDIHAISGFRDFGDYRLGRGFANLEYDPLCAVQLLSRVDARHRELARDMLTHFATYDLSNGERGTPAGVPWMHGDDHRSYEIEPGHVFLDGLVVAALTRLDDRSTLGRVSSGILALAGERDLFEHERDYGWMIRALAALAVTFDDSAARQRAQEIGRALLALQARSGAFRIDRGSSREGAGGAYVVSPWVTALVTTEALYRLRVDSEVRDESLRRELRDAMVGIARFLSGDARFENGEFASSVGYDSTGDVVVERKGMANPIDRLCIAAGFGRLALTGIGDCGERFEAEVAAAQSALAKWPPLHGNEAARALVALRSIADSRHRLGATDRAAATRDRLGQGSAGTR